MAWSDIEAIWHELTDQILENWTDLDADHLVTAVGDRLAFATYVARTHDLAPGDVLAAIESWSDRHVA